MKHWRIHFCWAIATALAVVVSARIAAPPESSSPPHACPRPSAVPTESKPDEPPKTEAPVPTAVPIPVPATDPVNEGATLVARLRALFKTQNAWEDMQKLTADVANREALLEALKQILDEPDYQGRFFAIAALRLLKGRESAKILEDFLARNWLQGDGIAASAASALGEFGDASSMPILNQTVHSKNEDLRLSSAEALLRLGYGGPAGDIVAAMTRQFDHADGALRKKALETLSRLQPQASIPLLVRGLRDSNGDVRLQAIWGLESVEGGKAYLPMIQALLNDPNPEVAEAAKQFVDESKDM